VSMIDFIDGYFLALIAGSQIVQWSAIEDGTSWNPGNFFQVSIFPDNVIAMKVEHQEIWLFGPKKTVPYYNTGDLLNPFQPIPGQLIEQGTGSQWAITELDNTLFWLGLDERGQSVAWRLNGYVPQRVSNHAAENAWRQYGDISGTIGYAFQTNGHIFWQLYFPPANQTWRYDVATGEWHQPAFQVGGIFSAHRSRTHAFAFGKHIVGDISSGWLYQMDISLTTDNVNGHSNQPILSLRRSAHIQKEKLWGFHRRLQIDAQAGYGPSNSQLALRWSDDGANTWSNYYQLSLGTTGQYTARAIRWMLGRTRDRIYEISTTDYGAKFIVDGYVEVDLSNG